MNLDSTLAVTKTCPKDGVHLSLQSQMTGVIAVKPEGGKLARAQAVAPSPHPGQG